MFTKLSVNTSPTLENVATCASSDNSLSQLTVSATNAISKNEMFNNLIFLFFIFIHFYFPIFM